MLCRPDMRNPSADFDSLPLGIDEMTNVMIGMKAVPRT